MSTRKFKADFLFTGNNLLAENHVLITDENGIVIDIAEQTDAGDDIEIFDGVISPGFINCHCHLELSHMKNVIESGTGLVDFLLKVMSNRSAVKKETEHAMMAAEIEMVNNGIVAVGDICNKTDTINIKQKTKLQYYNFVEVPGFTEERAKERFDIFLNIYNAFCDAGFEKNTSLVPHAPYTVSAAMFNFINDYSTYKTISIHNQESVAEDELYKTKTGEFLRLYHHLHINTDFFQPYEKSSLQSYLPLLNKAQKIVLVHNTFTTENDIDFSVEQSRKTKQEIFWCLCPNANLYIENRLPPVQLFSKKNCRIVLGTDGYSSNRSLNILDEMKTLQHTFPSIQLKEMLVWATLNGAKALGYDDKLGSFEKNKKPGIVVISNLNNQQLTAATSIKRLL